MVYASPKSIKIEPSIAEIDSIYLNVSCQVKGVYPDPIIQLSWTKNSTSNRMDKTDTLVKTGPSGLLDVTVSSFGLREEITPDVVMGCEVTIPDTQFYIREELELLQYPRLKSRYISSSSLMLVSCVCLVFSIQASFISRT